MRVKLVVNAFPTASETFLFNLVTGLEARGVEMTVTVLSRAASTDLYRERMHEWSGRLDYIPLRGNPLERVRATVTAAVASPQRAAGTLRRLGPRAAPNAMLRAHHLAAGDPDIVHFAYSGMAISYLDAVDALGAHRPKLFVSCRGSAEKVKPITVADRAAGLRRLFATVDRVHCVSEDMLAGLEPYGLRRDQAFVNFPSIDIAHFRRTSPYPTRTPERWTITSTGRLHFQKGYVYGLLALRELKQKGIPFHYHVLGDGPDREMLTYAIHELGLRDDITLHGRVGGAEVKRLLATTDLFLLPSLYEGIANAALEAMAMEIPIVTTTAGGMAEVIEHGVNGMIVDRFDPPALARAIEDLVRSGERRARLGVAGRATIEKLFRLDHQLDKFIAEYRRALA